MSTQLQPVPTVETLPQRNTAAWTQEEAEAVKNQIAPQASPEDFKLFLYTATQRGLNPLLKQIYCITRSGKSTFQVSIDGYRAIAHRTKKLKGIERGVIYNDKGELTHAWAKVYRKDWEIPAFETVALKEYKGSTPTWTTMPESMLKKVAEAAALRIAFPEDLSGLYTHEEMDQADKSGPITPEEMAYAKQTAPKQIPNDDRKQRADLLSQINEEIKNQGLTKEDVKDITGLDTFANTTNNDLLDALASLAFNKQEAELTPTI